MKAADDALRAELANFAAQNGFRGEGPLSVALVVTQHARVMGLPLDPEELITEGGGQVLGLGKGAVQAVLKRHGISRVLASEGGRTSRGSLHNMRRYVAFLNGQAQRGEVDPDTAEAFWIERVHEFFLENPSRSNSMPPKVYERWFAMESRRRRNAKRRRQACITPTRFCITSLGRNWIARLAKAGSNTTAFRRPTLRERAREISSSEMSPSMSRRLPARR